ALHENRRARDSARQHYQHSQLAPAHKFADGLKMGKLLQSGTRGRRSRLLVRVLSGVNKALLQGSIRLAKVIKARRLPSQAGWRTSPELFLRNRITDEDCVCPSDPKPRSWRCRSKINNSLIREKRLPSCWIIAAETVPNVQD